ncbi:hypothetical protein [Streptacidiphilus sp. PAMC 29251]
MVIVMVLFATLGIGVTVFRAVRRRWLAAAASLLGTACAEMGYASVITHQSWLAAAATVVALGGSAALLVLMRRSERPTAEQQPD